MKTKVIYRTLSIFIIGIFFGSCKTKYIRTVKICESNLFVEIFQVGPGVNAHYLTDSANFRLNVGKYDNEHQNFSYSCKEDSITILKIEASVTQGGKREIVSTQKYSLSVLKASKDFR